MDAVSSLCRQIRATPKARFAQNGATEHEVREVERQLGVSLPIQYRTFLRELGYAIGDGWVVNGIGSPLG